MPPSYQPANVPVSPAEFSGSPPSPPRAPATSLRRPTVTVLVLAALLRIAVLVLRWSELQADPDSYRQLAEAVAQHGVFGKITMTDNGASSLTPTAYRPPLYPLLLASTAWHGRVAVGAVAIWHLAAGLSTVALTLQVARRLGAGRAAPLAALLVAADPILLHQSTLVMTETLAALFTVALVWALERLARGPTWKAAALAGSVVGLAALCRPTFLPLAPLLALLAWQYSPAPRRQGLLLAGTLFLTSLLILSPWLVRNRMVFHRWIATTTHGGYTLLLGNNPDFYHHLATAPWGVPWWLPSDDYLLRTARAERPLDAQRIDTLPAAQRELAEDQLAYDCARAHMAANPAACLHACAYRLGQFWNPWPHATSPHESLARRGARYATGVWYLLLYGALIRATLRRDRAVLSRVWWPSLLIIACFSAAHVLYWSNVRMRGPVIPALALVATLGLGGGASRPPGEDP